MDEITTLKAKVYDLLAAKQQIEIQLQQANQQIIELSQKKEKADEPKN